MIVMVMDAAAIQPVDVERAVAAGIDDCLFKPLDKRELLPRLANLLALKRLADRNIG
jgi:PleD family two-component response regulator